MNYTPSVIELSFSNQMKIHRTENLTQSNKLPINKEQPNNSEGIDYLVTFN